MPPMTDFAPGMPCWTDVSSPGIAETVAFYAGMFEWEGRDLGPEAGHYTILTLRGQSVGAIAPQMDPSVPPAWRIYISTADIDATAEAVTAAGGQVVVPPMDVMTAGRMAVFLDPTGAAINGWQPGETRGVDARLAVNTWTWSDLLSRDLPAATAFYSAVFGWGLRENPNYSEWQLGGQSIGGLMAMPDQVPATMPAFWTPYIGVDDVDAALARATELGGAVRVPTQEFAGGQLGIIEDVHHAALGVLRLGPAA